MVNVGILGAGEIAVKMAMTLQPLKGVSCYAIASRDIGKAQTFADKYGFNVAYGSYGEMLRDEYVDLVYIATPHSHHYEHIKMCIERGKNVLCEKPICANADQAEEVFRLAEERGVLVTEAMWPRYMPLLDTRREKNLLGTLISDLVLTIFSYVAENERLNIKQRQAEGIKAAKLRGVKFGRPPKSLPPNFHEVYQKWRNGNITLIEAARRCNMPESTFRYRANKYKKDTF